MPSGGRLGELPSLLDSLPRLDEADAAAFTLDLERFRQELNADGPLDPWES